MNLASFYVDDSFQKEPTLLDCQFPGACSVKFTSILTSDLYQNFEGADFGGDQWSFVREVKKFTETPSKKVLANCIRLARNGISLSGAWQRGLPWPISVALAEASQGFDLEKIASEIEIGVRGDFEQWLAAEQRWEKLGITEDDLFSNDEDRWFDAKILASVASPGGAYRGSRTQSRPQTRSEKSRHLL